MTIAQLLVWSKVIPTLVAANILAAEQVGPLLKSCHPTLADDEVLGLVALFKGDPK